VSLVFKKATNVPRKFVQGMSFTPGAVGGLIKSDSTCRSIQVLDVRRSVEVASAHKLRFFLQTDRLGVSGA